MGCDFERIAATVTAKVKGVLYRIQTFALRAELRSGGASIHPSARLGRFYFVGNPAMLSIGQGAVVNDRVLLNVGAPVVIGDYASVSVSAQVHTGYLRSEGKPREHEYAPVTICDNAWIAAGAIISAGVTVGANSIVGAGSVVTRDVESDVMVAGIPARFVRSLDS